MAKVLVNFIQDRSGSMTSSWEEVLSGYKKFVEDLRDNAEGTEYLFSLTTFDTLVDTPIVAKPIGKVDVDALRKYGPRGMTALYDAVGVTIRKVEEDRHGCEKIIVVVVTDGQENSSGEWDKDKLHAAIDAKLAAGDWTFTYLGTQPETWNDASAIGMGAGATATYTAGQASAAYGVVAASCNALSASAMRGTRTMMYDNVSPAQAKAAGMHVRHQDPPRGHQNPPRKPATPRSKPQTAPRRPKPSVKVKKGGSGRWR